MNFREFVDTLRNAGRLIEVEREVDCVLEAAALISALDERPLLLHHLSNSTYSLVAGVCSERANVALGLGIAQGQMLSALTQALHHPSEPPLLRIGTCQEVVEESPDLRSLPVLTHLRADGGPYVTAGVAVVKDPELGRNLSFHRLMRLDERHFAVRLVEGRGTHTALAKAGGTLEAAICIGSSPAVLLAGAMSPAPGVDELGIANALAPTPLVKCRSVDLEVPAETEIVLEGRILPQTVSEGPFLDLTETMDVVRSQHVMEVRCITHRRDAIYQALLPGGLEHKLLMGMPREPTIFEEVSQVCDCVSVRLTAGGGSWLHGVVQIRKRAADDGRRAIEAALRGHPSLKHVLVVDDDIQVEDPTDLEWAIATRFQADRDLMVLPDQPGSSLDPSALHVPGAKSRTTKVGVDATIPWRTSDGRARSEQERAGFRKVRYDAVSPSDYLSRREKHD